MCVISLCLFLCFFHSFLQWKEKQQICSKLLFKNYYHSRIIFFPWTKNKNIGVKWGLKKKANLIVCFSWMVDGVCVCNVCVWNFSLSLSRGLCVDKYLLDVLVLYKYHPETQYYSIQRSAYKTKSLYIYLLRKRQRRVCACFLSWSIAHFKVEFFMFVLIKKRKQFRETIKAPDVYVY